MITPTQIVEVDTSFRERIKERLSKHGRKSRAAKEMGLARSSIFHFIKRGTVRMHILETIVRKFEGDQADINDYIQKL
jgi:hypothetical protein